MANLRSARKAQEQSVRRRVFNVRRLRTMKDSVKSLAKLVSEKKKEDAEQMIPTAYKAIDKAQKRGLIKKNTASRKKSRLAKQIASIE